MGKQKPSKIADVTQVKAKFILREGRVQGNPLAEKQRRFFGAIAGGKFKKK